ncbi:thioredoxin [Marinobacter sp. 1Y8]|eukprot:GHVR01026206.1.p1 GENE.GHVR01026206.1~~GHVR01026206.1.p1  ORF type:complete len:109 (+),score=18.14 GHVR01026206.1:86-412(+)
MSNQPVAVTNETFEQEVLKADKTVLVDFWAAWCGPCKSIGPLLEDIADDQSDTLKVAKVDVDAQGELAVKFGVRSIPTLMLFKDGAQVGTQIGALGKGELNEFIQSHS